MLKYMLLERNTGYLLQTKNYKSQTSHTGMMLKNKVVDIFTHRFLVYRSLYISIYISFGNGFLSIF